MKYKMCAKGIEVEPLLNLPVTPHFTVIYDKNRFIAKTMGSTIVAKFCVR